MPKYKEYMERNLNIPRTTRYRLQKQRKFSDEDSSSDDMQNYYKLSKNEQEDNLADIQNESLNSHNNLDAVKRWVDSIERSSNLSFPVYESEELSDCNSIHSNSSNETSNVFDDREQDVPIVHWRDYDCNQNGSDEYVESDNSDFLSDIDNNANVEEENLPKLSDILNNESFNQVINAVPVVNLSEMLLAVLKFSLKYSLPNSALQDLCKMINSFFNSNVLPDTKYRLNKLLEDNKDVEYHAVCPNCELYLKLFNRKERFINCNNCNNDIPLKGTNVNFFITLNVKDEIKNLLQNNADYYDSIMNQRRIQAKIKDIYDGLEYKKFVQSLPIEDRKSYATCIFNTDGSPVFNSSSYSIWPIQIILNELPIVIRNSKPITFALWFGKNKPKMNIFMNIFVDIKNALSIDGISCNIKNEIKNIKIYAITSCVDSVARAPMQDLIQFNGYYGCNWCLHPGILVQHKKKRVIKYPLLDYIPTARNETETLQHMVETQNAHRSVFGVKNASALINLKHFNIIRGFVPDIMHCVALGVGKQFANYWFSTSGEPYSVNNSNIEKINETLKTIQVPIHVARLSRPLKDRKYWKAREWDNWILYYSVPILHGLPNFEIYLEHWKLLVESLHILMSPSIHKTV